MTIYAAAISAIGDLKGDAYAGEVTGKPSARVICVVADDDEIAEYLAIGYAYRLWPPHKGWTWHRIAMIVVPAALDDESGPMIWEGEDDSDAGE